MPHPGYQDEAPPSSTDVYATNPNYNARTRLPPNVTPKLPSAVVYQPATTPTAASTPAESYWKWASTPQYVNGPYGSSIRQNFVDKGMVYRWNPRSGRYEVTSVQTQTPPANSSGGGSTGGKVDPYAKMKRDAEQSRLAARTDYMQKLNPIQENARLARVNQAESTEMLSSNLAQSAIGGFGGISEGAKQYVGDQYRMQEAQQIAKIISSHADYLTTRLKISRDEAFAIAKEAVKRADAGAAKIIAEAERRVAEVEKSTEEALNISKRYQDSEMSSYRERSK